MDIWLETMLLNILNILKKSYLFHQLELSQTFKVKQNIFKLWKHVSKAEEDHLVALCLFSNGVLKSKFHLWEFIELSAQLAEDLLEVMLREDKKLRNIRLK